MPIDPRDARLAEVERERDEALATMAASNANALRAQHDATDGDARWVREQARIAKERDAALAANAELRAALEHWTHIYSKALSPPGHDTYGEGMRDAKDQVRAILSRPDLGAGWASPEDTAQMVGALQMVESDGEFDSLHEVTRKFVVDVLALLKRGGG